MKYIRNTKKDSKKEHVKNTKIHHFAVTYSLYLPMGVGYLNKIIGAVLNSLFFFYKNISHAQKAQKAQKA